MLMTLVTSMTVTAICQSSDIQEAVFFSQLSDAQKHSILHTQSYEIQKTVFFSQYSDN
jgi:hypothetical protein